MEKRTLIEHEAEKTLRVMDGIGEAEVNPYLYSKILNGINEPAKVEKRFNFKLALGTIVICLFANLATLFSLQSYNSTPVSNASNNISDSVRYTQIKSFTSEYFSISNIYFY